MLKPLCVELTTQWFKNRHCGNAMHAFTPPVAEDQRN